MTLNTLRALPLAACLLAGSMPAAFASAPSSQAVQVLREIQTRLTAALPDHAAAGTAIEGRLDPAALDAERITVPLGDGRRIEAVRVQEFRRGPGDATWSGEVVGNPGSMAIITTHRGAVSGFLHVGPDIWEIVPTTSGRARIFRVDPAKLPPDSEPLAPEFDNVAADAAGTAGTQEATVAADGPIVQDVLVIYTARSASLAGSVAQMESKIVNAVAAANTAYANSQVDVTLNLVGMAQTDYVETGDFGTSLSRLRGTNDGYMDDVHALRNDLGADLVALVSADDAYCGMAYLMGSPSTSFASSAFSVTHQNCFSNQTFAHELGHNQGNSHDRANGSAGVFEYSFGYRTCDNVAPTNGQTFRTVMAYNCSASVPRINYFANPRVYYNGAPMGVDHALDPANSADTARSMNATAAYVAAFRSAPAINPPAAPDGLSAAATAWDRAALTWNDNAADETGYVVQRSVNGGTWSDRATLPNNSFAHTDTGLAASTTYSYRVRAYNSAGSSAYSNVVTVTTPAAPPPPADPSPATVAPGTTGATLTWANVDNETGYQVVRETYNSRKGTWSSTTLSVAANVTSLSETLSSGTYRYRVRAIGSSGNSQYVTGTCSTCGTGGSFTISGGSKSGGGKPSRR